MVFNSKHDYSLFFNFLEKYLPSGFTGIDRSDPFMLEMEQMLNKNDQFFYLADIIQIKVLFTSNGSTRLIGIEPDILSPYHFMIATHPNDIHRLNLGRAKVIKMGHDLYAAESGFRYLSSNFKIKTPGDQYSEFLIQNYLFYTTIPYKTAFYLKVHTKIDWFKKFKRGYHYYDGNDLQNFRYPDEKLLSIGNIFSQREFEIIKLVESGFSTDLIAQTLFLSPYTVNTHRRNILKKSGKANTSDLILELKERGLL